MATSSGSRPGTQLPTGWRVVGRNAERIAERARAQTVEHLTPGGIDDTLYAVQCTWKPAVNGRPTVERALDAITEEVRQTWAECPRLMRDDPVERPPSRFGGFRYVFRAEPGEAWVGEVLWRAVHPVVAGAPITTRVLLEESKHYTRLSLRVTADEGRTSVRGYVGAGQAQPPFLRELCADLTPSWLGGPLMTHPIRVGGEAEFVQGVLHSRSRDFPVAVLSPLEEGGYVVEPEDLAWDLLGRARLYVLGEHQQTFNLSDAVGDRTMSCYWGAARCYLPDWSRYDDPFEHPLLVRDRLADPVMRATWLGEIGVWMGEQTELPPTIVEPDPEPTYDLSGEAGAAEPGAVAEAPPERDPAATDDADSGIADPESSASVRGGPAGKRAETAAEAAAEEAAAASAAEARAKRETAADAGSPVEGASPAGGGSAVEPRSPAEEPSWAADLRHLPGPLLEGMESVESLVGDLLRSNAELVDEVERLRTIAAVRSSSTNAIERRLGRLEDILERAFPEGGPGAAGDEAEADESERAAAPEEEEEEGALRLEDVVRQAADSHPDAIIFLDSAFDSAAESPYEDPERVRAILDAMARVSRRRRDGALGTSLREAFSDLGIDYRGAIARSTPERLRRQYRFVHPDGELVEAEEHVVLGRTYNPRRCLRVYFSSRVPNEPRFVIGHVGRHFEVLSST